MSVDDLLAACRILDGEGLTGPFGHVSARRGDGRLLITPLSGPGTVRGAEALVELELGGQVVGGDAATVPGEAAIHLAVLGARVDVGAVCRFHGPACMAFSTLGRPLPATTGMGMFLGHEVPWIDTRSTLTTPEQAAPLVDALGASGVAALMRGFGAVTAGPGVAEAVARAWLLERSAAAAVAAGRLGDPLAYDSADAEPFLGAEGVPGRQLRRVWAYLLARWAA